MLDHPSEVPLCSSYCSSQRDRGSSPQATDDTLQMQQHIRLQQWLRQVERKLRSSLDPLAILGATVVETAHLFGLTQASLLQYDPASRCWQQVARYCQNQALAWSPPLSLTQATFPFLTGQLRQGKPLQIFAGQLLPVTAPETNALTADAAPAPHGVAYSDGQSVSGISPSCLDEIQQWLMAWPGSWLLMPIRNSRLATYFLNGFPMSAGSRLLSEELGTSASLSETLSENLPAALSDRRLEKETSGHWGVMALALPEQENWVDGAIAAAQSIALELALALEQAHQYQELIAVNQELQKLALSDGLTSLANRRRFDEHLIDEWQRLTRDQQPLSLILCDLDHFKRYNDTFGHPAGDRCLIRVARALLQGPQRPADLVARYGGEEFAIILPNTDTHGAWRIAQKIHNSIHDLKIAHAPGNEEAYVTVTMGISTVVPSLNSTAQILVKAADLALYHAKQHGRNRTYVHALHNTVDSARLDDDGLQPQVIPSDSAALS